VKYISTLFFPLLDNIPSFLFIHSSVGGLWVVSASAGYEF
jgi:hypothetical protein